MLTSKRRLYVFTLFCIVIYLTKLNTSFGQTPQVTIPLGGNSWIQNGEKIEALMDTNGVTNWKLTNSIICTYVYFEKPCIVDLALRLKVNQGKSRLKLICQGTSQIIDDSIRQFHTTKAGRVEIKKAGYAQISLEGISKTGTSYADITDIIIEGLPSASKLAYVKSNIDNFYYWGHRGPSIHLNYSVPERIKSNVEWFYNEITVPKGKDPVGSYFMANGFKEGYFGIQVNSENERRILFSIWSPFVTDDPKSIPDSLKIKMLKKGGKVKVGEFGAEGSGGQSYLVFNWKAGITYKFLTQAKPIDQNNTVYTSYFFDPDQSKWMLIASFQRPSTHTYLKNLHSFLENFDPDKGTIIREANYGNQWVRDTNRNWHLITQANFTGDATAKKGYRKDYAGGLSNNNSTFFLRNCGFFSDFVRLNQSFNRMQQNNNHPEIDFDTLQKIE